MRLTAVIATMALLGLTLSAAVGAADTVSVLTLRGGLHLLQGRGGNVVVSLGDDGVLMVDDDYPELAAAYRQALDRLAGAERGPRFLLNTHWHGDHTGNNGHWAAAGAVLIAHANVRQRMSTRQDMPALGRVVEPSPAAALPVVTFADALSVHFNGDDVEVRHYPGGHTDGDSVVYFSRNNVVHMGDLFFRDRFPFVDLGSGGGVAAYTANVAEVLARIDDQTLVVPGHGALASRADLERFHAMLTATTAAVRTALSGGESLDDVIARGLGDQWADWGAGFIGEEQWIRTIAASP